MFTAEDIVDLYPRLRRLRLMFAATTLAVTTIFGCAGRVDRPQTSTAAKPPMPVRFDEIDVGRINVREDDGSLRMVISNQSRFPGLIYHGVEHPHPDRKTAGVLFFNSEGTENGGLIFDGGMVDGQPWSGGSLTFDQYDQDQVIQFTAHQNGDRRFAGMIVNDVPVAPMDLAGHDAVRKMPEGPEKAAELARLAEGYVSRLFAGKSIDHGAVVSLCDGAGRIRLRLKVTEEGEASIQFLDASGTPTREIRATDSPAK